MHRCGGEEDRSRPKTGKEEGEEVEGDRQSRIERRGGILKVLPFFRNINEQRVIVRGLSDREKDRQRVGGGREMMQRET